MPMIVCQVYERLLGLLNSLSKLGNIGWSRAERKHEGAAKSPNPYSRIIPYVPILDISHNLILKPKKQFHFLIHTKLTRILCR